LGRLSYCRHYYSAAGSVVFYYSSVPEQWQEEKIHIRTNFQPFEYLEAKQTGGETGYYAVHRQFALI